MKMRLFVLLLILLCMLACSLSDIWQGTLDRSQQGADSFKTQQADQCKSGRANPEFCSTAEPTPDK